MLRHPLIQPSDQHNVVELVFIATHVIGIADLVFIRRVFL